MRMLALRDVMDVAGHDPLRDQLEAPPDDPEIASRGTGAGQTSM
jgi:hypothetical protein